VDNPAKGIEIAETAQKHFPNLKIIARSSSYEDFYNYMDRDMLKVYQENYYSSFNIGIDTHKELGLRHDQESRADVKEIVKRMTKDGLTSNSITLDQFDANNSNQET
jgi:site-specific recombinase XerC